MFRALLRKMGIRPEGGWLKLNVPSAHASVVHRAAMWLDTRYPGWVARINLNRLDLRHWDHCVLAQVTNGNAKKTVSDYVGEFNGLDWWAFNRAFVHASHNDWLGLRIAWEREIAERVNESELEDAVT